MTLQELINELQKLKSRVNEDIEVEVCIFYDREDFQMDQIDILSRLVRMKMMNKLFASH